MKVKEEITQAIREAPVPQRAGFTQEELERHEAILCASPDPGESQLETDPLVSAKRTAQMQQMTADSLARTTGEMEPVGRLTIIWETEKKDIYERLETHAKLIEELNQRMASLEKAFARLVTEPKRP